MNAVLAELPISLCDRCAGCLRVWSPLLRKLIRCTKCTTVALPYDPDALRRLTREERRRARIRAAVTVVEMLGEEFRPFGALPPELITTNRVLERWAAFGSGMPSECPDVYRIALPPALDPETQAQVSERVRETVPTVRGFTYQWFCSPMPVQLIARRRRMSRRSLERYLHDVLRVHRERFLVSGYSDLIALIRAQP